MFDLPLIWIRELGRTSRMLLAWVKDSNKGKKLKLQSAGKRVEWLLYRVPAWATVDFQATYYKFTRTKALNKWATTTNFFIFKPYTIFISILSILRSKSRNIKKFKKYIIKKCYIFLKVSYQPQRLKTLKLLKT